MKIAVYDSSLIDPQWKYLQPMLPKPKPRGRPPTDRRCVIDAILYVARGGIQWRLLPTDFPPSQTVYHIFRRWTLTKPHLGRPQRRAPDLRSRHRGQRRPSHRRDSGQPKCEIRSSRRAGGYDAGKRIKGRKRHLLVDTLGLVLGVLVTPA